MHVAVRDRQRQRMQVAFLDSCARFRADARRVKNRTLLRCAPMTTSSLQRSSAGAFREVRSATLGLLGFDRLACGDFAAPCPLLAADRLPVLVGTVTKVVDGDTIDVQLSSGPIRIRFHGIDPGTRTVLVYRGDERL